MLRGKERADLNRDRQLNLSLVRLLEIIGEAAGRISGPTRELYPNIAWAEIVGMRNRLIHGYDAVDFDILWAIVRTDWPALIVDLERMLRDDFGT